jgi:hypothetical protein
MAREVLMATITLPSDLEERLAEEARRQGTTPELLALESLRRLFIPTTVAKATHGRETLWDFLSGYIGTVSCSAEALSENCGQHFADG